MLRRFAMELYVKAGPDGKAIGDCPFSQYVRMVMVAKNVYKDCKVIPCAPDAKPEWLNTEFKGAMPCLNDHGNKMVESSVIVDYLDKKFPEPNLRSATVDKFMDETKNVFPALAKLMKLEEFNFYAERDLITALKDLNEKIASEKEKPYVVGTASASLADCSLSPKLFILKHALIHFYPDTWAKVEEQCPTVVAYMNFVFDSEMFKSTTFDKEFVPWGWKNARLAQKSCGI